MVTHIFYALPTTGKKSAEIHHVLHARGAHDEHPGSSHGPEQPRSMGAPL